MAWQVDIEDEVGTDNGFQSVSHEWSFRAAEQIVAEAMVFKTCWRAQLNESGHEIEMRARYSRGLADCSQYLLAVEHARYCCALE